MNGGENHQNLIAYIQLCAETITVCREAVCLDSYKILKNTATEDLLSTSSNTVYLRSVRLRQPKNSLNALDLISRDVQQQDNKSLIRDAMEVLVLMEASGSFLCVRFSWHVPTYLPQRADPPGNSICEKVAFNFSGMRENEEGSF